MGLIPLSPFSISIDFHSWIVYVDGSGPSFSPKHSASGPLLPLSLPALRQLQHASLFVPLKMLRFFFFENVFFSKLPFRITLILVRKRSELAFPPIPSGVWCWGRFPYASLSFSPHSSSHSHHNTRPGIFTMDLSDSR